MKIENINVSKKLIGKDVAYVPDFLLEDYIFGKKLPLNDIDFGKIAFISDIKDTVYVTYEKSGSIIATDPQNIKWRDNVKVKVY